MGRLVAMEVFVRVIETGTFSGAARQLRIGQPAVSKIIAQLEERLGVHLLLRSNRGLTPTLAGQNFYERAKRVVEDANEAELVARGTGTALSGRLRVCATVSFARLHIIPHLPAFLAQHPELDIEVVMDDRAVDLVEEGIDIALRMGPLSDSTLTARKIGQCKRLVLGTPAYFSRAGIPLTPADLVTHQAIVLVQPALTSVWNFKQGTTETSVTAQGRVRVTAGEGVRAAVLADIGLSVTSEWLFAAELKEGVVVPVLQDWELVPLDLWSIFPTGRRATAKARVFAAFVEELVSNGKIITTQFAG
ncbi:transcriptional regulator [Herbaspirillum sp. meg3]|uniref:LysR family transcriptional regulator n=1 Tax=Herbaspirillum sp. meg3 TaxID=2025949 RepID=UPI000B98F8B0|nr:LysR family transcriptional regulator [Herbaspirillum sp. meg3]ASU37560.1 transcriptional regulator [Herbaspirillum sp. meg3]